MGALRQKAHLHAEPERNLGILFQPRVVDDNAIGDVPPARYAQYRRLGRTEQDREDAAQFLRPTEEEYAGQRPSILSVDEGKARQHAQVDHGGEHIVARSRHAVPVEELLPKRGRSRELARGNGDVALTFAPGHRAHTEAQPPRGPWLLSMVYMQNRSSAATASRLAEQ